MTPKPKKHKQIDAMAIDRKHPDFKRFSDLASKKILKEEATRLKRIKQRFEHRCEMSEEKYIGDTLRKYEEQGYELVSASPLDWKDDYYSLFFKRPV